MCTSLRSLRRSVEAAGRDYDARELSGDGAVRAMEDLGAIRHVIDGMLARTAKQVADTDVHLRRGERSAPAFVARSLGMSVGEVRSAIDTAEKLDALPATDARVRAGKLSSKQAEMIADAASANPDAESALLAAAAQGLAPLKDACVKAKASAEEPGERARRQRGLRSLRMWTDTDGMLAGRFRLTPEVGGRVKARLDAEVQRIFRSRRKGTEHEPHERYAADALSELVLADRPGPGKHRDPNATVHIVIDHGALMRGGAGAGEVCEIPGVGPVDVGWVRELIGSAFLTAVIKKGKDLLTVAHLGRHVPAEVQTALLVAGRECDIAGCHHRGYLERDHTREYAQGGPTAYWNLRWLCWVHHRLKSAGWVVGPPDPQTGKCALRAPPARAA
jgi:hypothetical protein